MKINIYMSKKFAPTSSLQRFVSVIYKYELQCMNRIYRNMIGEVYSTDNFCESLA